MSLFSSLLLFFFCACTPLHDERAVNKDKEGLLLHDDATSATQFSGIPIHGPQDILDAESHFQKFVSMFSKKYSSPEVQAHRFRIFRQNLAKAVQHAILDPSAIHGITKFSDLTEDEFRGRYHGLKMPPSFAQSGPEAPTLPTDDLPASFNWRDHGAVTKVKNQGECGSCWSFSTTGALEGANFLATGELLSLSEQQLVDCDHVCDPEETDSCNSGCDGGMMTNAFNYIMQAGGLQLEKDYPYTGSDGNCTFDKTKIAAQVANFSNVASDEHQIAANLVKNGPLAIAIDSKYMGSYIGGVSCPHSCNITALDHGVLLVGYAGNNATEEQKPYWIIKNSWGSDWGEEGYYKLCSGYDKCGMDTAVSTVAAKVFHRDH